MRGITLCQPWATLVASGAKTIETRSWATKYRGIIAIHAGKGLAPVGGRIGLQAICADQPFRAAIEPEVYEKHETRAGERYPTWDLRRLPFGAVVATATLFACVPTASARYVAGPGCDGWSHERTGLAWPLTDQERAFGDYSPGRFAWLLADVRRLAVPVPCRGALGLWAVSELVQIAIEDRLKES